MPDASLRLRVSVVCCSCGVRAATIPRYVRFAQQVERARRKGLHGDELVIYVRALVESYARFGGARGDCRLQIPNGKWQTAGRGPGPLSSAGGLERRVLVRLAGELFTIRVPQPGR